MTAAASRPHKGTFAERIRFLVADRAVTRWAEFLGIPAGTRSRMLKGEGIPPTYETLARIMRVEGVSLSWLLGADVAPYMVWRTLSDAETAGRLFQVLEDEPDWKIELLTDGERAAVVLHQPAEIDHKSIAIPYVTVEVVAGPFGEESIRQVIKANGGFVQQICRVTSAVMRDIYAGMLGTYQLVGDAKRRGLVDIAKDGVVDIEKNLDNLSRHRLRVAESLPPYGEIPKPIAPLARWWPLLSDAERNAITTLLDPVLENAARRLQHGKA